LGKKIIQEVTGFFLFLARAVDSSMLTPLSALASEQAAPTEKTMQNCLQFLDYAASQDKAIVNYRASDMKLAIHSDASYLSKPKARSRAGGHMFMAGSEEIPINNGAVLNISQIIKAVMSSAAEATHSHPNRQFHRTRTTHQQDPPQGIEGHGYAIQLAMMPRCTRPISILLETGNTDLADYWTKHHPASHHKSFRPQILTSPTDPEYLKVTTPQNTVYELLGVRAYP
jgi:hypothetical protein